MRGRRLAGVVLAIGGLVAGCGSGGRQAANDAAAQADVTRLVNAERLPHGAVRLGSDTPPSFEGTADGRTAEVRWRVPGETPTEVYEYVDAHPPADLNVPFSPGAKNHVPAGLDAMTFGLKPVADVDSRTVMVEASAAPGGTSVRVLAEVAPIIVRAAASKLPTDVRRIRVSVTSPRGRTLTSALITSVSRVTATVRFFNGLEAGQPVTINCPEEPGEPTVITLSFLSGSGASLARATYQDVFDGTSDACSAVELTVAGHPYSVYGGSYVSSLDRLLSVSLPR